MGLLDWVWGARMTEVKSMKTRTKKDGRTYPVADWRFHLMWSVSHWAAGWTAMMIRFEREKVEKVMDAPAVGIGVLSSPAQSK